MDMSVADLLLLGGDGFLAASFFFPNPSCLIIVPDLFWKL